MRALIALLLCLVIPAVARAEIATIAVATNFRPAAEVLAKGFQADTGHEIRLVAGATGKLAAQIVNGAPFDAFLSADAETPERLASTGHAIAGTQFTYATGTLVLWSPDAAHDLSDPAAALSAARHVALANPKLAPYGKAAMQAIERIGLIDMIESRIVMGENVGQAHALTATGAAELGFVAASAVTDGTGARWTVPPDYHDPIRQDAVLLDHGRENPAARAFLAYLGTDAAHAVIRGFGYRTGS